MLKSMKKLKRKERAKWMKKRIVKIKFWIKKKRPVNQLVRQKKVEFDD